MASGAEYAEKYIGRYQNWHGTKLSRILMADRVEEVWTDVDRETWQDIQDQVDVHTRSKVLDAIGWNPALRGLSSDLDDQMWDELDGKL